MTGGWALEPAPPTPIRTPHAQRAFEVHRRAILSDPSSSTLAKFRVNQNMTLDDLAAATEISSPYDGSVIAGCSVRTLKRAEASDPSVSDETWGLICRALTIATGKPVERRFIDDRHAI